MMYVHRCIGVALATLGVVFGGLALASAPALATGPYTYEKSLEQPSEPSQLGLGVGPNGELFAANLSNNKVDVYEPGATPKEIVAEFTVATEGESYKLAVDDASATASKVDVYVANLSGFVVEYAYDPETKMATEVGKITESLNEPASVAVGPEGDVYVGSFAHGEAEKGYVNKYSSTGTLITLELIKGLTIPESLAVDGSGNIYVASGVGALKCSSTGTCAAFGGAEVAKPDDGVTVGPEGDVYISVEGAAASTNYIFVYSTSGTLVESFGSDHVVNTPYGLAVGSSHAYVASDGEVSAFAGKAPTGESLTIHKTGTGAGTVECEVNKDTTFEACKSTYTKGDEITIEDTPEPGSKFEGWSAGTGSAAACTGTGTCTFKLEATSAVTAENNEIPLTKFKLTVTKSSKGEVTGAKAASEIACGPIGVKCEQEIEETREGELTAKGATGFKFDEWTEGPCAGAKAKENPCKFAMPTEAVTVAATYSVTHEFPLTVFVVGEGKINGGPIVECTSTGGTCTGEAEDKVTLTATAPAGSGYVFASWIGCKPTGAETCEIDMTEASDVVAVFVKEGTQGPAGTNGSNGATGEKGANGAKGATGVAGATGATGPAGANGATGPAGTSGATGPAGAPGPAGSAGQVELVTCKKAGKKQKCTTKTVSGTVKFTTKGLVANATLSRHGAVYASGTASSTNGSLSLRLTPLRKLRPGHYTLTLVSGAGKHETIRSESFTLS